MAGYTRQSVADIIANAVIKAAPVNAEYNAIRDAFTHATGHKHDGSSTEGAYVPLIADVDAFNKVVVDAVNDRISFYVQVGAGTVEQLRIQDGAFVPVTDSDIDLGAAGAEFKDLYIDGVGYIDTLAIHENATIVGTLGVTGLSTLATVDINGGNIDATIIGATTPAAATISSLFATTADINGGNIDATQIGAASPSTITGTTVNATNFIGPLTGNVTGNLTGNVTGNVTGDVTGDLTGNVTAGSGTSSFNNVTINGSLDMNAGTSTTITGLSNPVQGSDAATKTYVDAEVSAVIDAAPGALDTLNELAAALGDDANYATTTSATIATKLPKAGGTMTGAIAMGTSKITGLGTPTAGTDASTKTYVDTGDALKVTKSGDTMSGVLAMGANKITGVADPTLAQDAATKNYIDTTYGSTADAATSAGQAATSATNASNSASAAGTSETNAAGSATSAAASFDEFDDIYLGAKSANPTLDNDGDALVTGALHYNTSGSTMRVWGGTSWADAGSAINGTSERTSYIATAAQTTFSAVYDVGFVDVYLNGMKLYAGSDFTASSGTTVVLSTGVTVGDIVDIIAFGAFSVADTYTQAGADARFALKSTEYTDRRVYIATASQTSFVSAYTAGFVDVYLNGIKLQVTADFTATTGTTVVLTVGATVGDIVNIISYGTFTVADAITVGTADAKYAQLNSNLSDLASASTARTNLGLAIGSNVQAYDATIVVDADIGVTVQAYNATYVVDADIGTTVLSPTGDGSGLTGLVATLSGLSDSTISTPTNGQLIQYNTATSKWINADPVIPVTDSVQALTDATTIAWNISLGNIGTVTLAASRTIGLPTNLNPGSSLLRITQDGTGSRLLTWNAIFKWSGGGAPVLSTAAGAIDVISFVYDGTNIYGSLVSKGAA